jgi:hypothetical protein
MQRMDLLRLLCVLTVVAGFMVSVKVDRLYGRVLMLVGASALFALAAYRMAKAMRARSRREREEGGERDGG